MRILLFLLLSFFTSQSRAGNKLIQIRLEGEINASAARLLEGGLAFAEKEKASHVLIVLNTYGGLVDEADKMRTALLKAKPLTLVWIENNAASAGALISIACDSIYMSPGSTIGAATVVNAQGEVMPEKYQSYMRKKMRATAEETGRNPLIAEGMTDENIEIEGLKEKGQVITFTTKEALVQGFCNAEIKQAEEIFSRIGLNKNLVEEYRPGAMESLLVFLLNPAVSGLLLLLIFGGIYFEFKMPGTFIPISISALAALLYFAPLYMSGLAANWEIAAFVLGMLLLLLEVFVIPGFGLAGISGIILMTGGLCLALLRNVNFDFSYDAEANISRAVLLVCAGMIAPLLLLIIFGRKMLHSTFFKKAGLEASLPSGGSSTMVEIPSGTKVKTLSSLRPVGKIEFEGLPLPASSRGEYIESGSEVLVIGKQGNEWLVEKVKT